MTNPIPMTEIWRGDYLESIHFGHAVVCNGAGDILHSWGNANAQLLPRSSCKMIQALPLIESGAADEAGLTEQHLALACSSHQGAPIHTTLVARWLGDLGLTDDDLRCGPQNPGDRETRHHLIRANQLPCQMHNNCSGKHAGFLTYSKHAGAGPEYNEIDHPIQMAIREAIGDLSGQSNFGYAIDGCSAPNFETTIYGLARAMAFFASARNDGTIRNRAAARLVQAMINYPELVAGEGRACTELMRAMNNRVVVKTGAEGVFVAILPSQKIGMAVKIADGATRASECAITAILVKLGVLDAQHPAALKRMNTIQKNWSGIETGIIRPAEGMA